MSISQSLVTLSTGAAVALTTSFGEVIEVYLAPTTTIYLGGASTVTSSNGPITLTTAPNPNPFHMRIPAGSILYAGPASSSAITVNVVTVSL